MYEAWNHARTYNGIVIECKEQNTYLRGNKDKFETASFHTNLNSLEDPLMLGQSTCRYQFDDGK